MKYKEAAVGSIGVPRHLLKGFAGLIGDFLIDATRLVRIDLPTTKLLFDRVEA